MQLIFDDIQELKDFINEFMGNAAPTVKAPQVPSIAVQRFTEAPVATAHKTAVATTVAVSDAPRRGRPPKALTQGMTAAPKKMPQPVMVPRRRDGLTLTDRIRMVIDRLIKEGKAFSANTVYEEVYKQDSDVNKQSVITSVLKQMTTHYTKVSWVEAEGNGPRKIKLYNSRNSR
jgi:hypothetical protein